jgi:glycosyltransferase involved in cell wall biosynthesis
VFFSETLESLIRASSPQVEFIGEIDGGTKDAFLGGAAALLFPIEWPEPFGLVMIEALACGTPVIGWRRGSVPEVIDDGVTGCIVESIEQAVEAVGRLARLSRHACRETFEQRFVSRRMAERYLDVYRSVIAAG